MEAYIVTLCIGGACTAIEPRRHYRLDAKLGEYGGPGEMGMGMRMRMRIRMRMRACIVQTCTLLSESALPFQMLRSYPYDAGVLAFGLAF
eukprot:scaffold21362_cov73-Phaeocystis_antarctica.AAC.1